MDRNRLVILTLSTCLTSLSARRAWIEIAWIAKRALETIVALRKESVDRNNTMQIVVVIVYVALRKESVDRNLLSLILLTMFILSLSARRAWIEIVAWLDYSEKLLSLSARRAWIEITQCKL